MEFISVSEYALLHGVSERTVRNYCSQGKLEGAFLTGKTWNIPKQKARSNVLFLHIHFCNPQVIDTVNESIESAMAKSITSIINPTLIILIYWLCL